MNSLKKPIIHLYTICWNEEKMLDFFFNHYDHFIDEYFIYDDGSTDNTLKILKEHPHTHIYELENIKDSFQLASLKLQNSIWKESRLRADWVIIVDIDELIYHPKLIDYLIEATLLGITAIPSIGFQMISDFFPSNILSLTKQVKRGAYFERMNKLGFFNPKEIEFTNFTVGRHRAELKGNVVYPSYDNMLNLHYKYLSINYTQSRHEQTHSNKRKLDLKNNWGHRQGWSRKQLVQAWNNFNSDSIPNVFDEISRNHYLSKKHINKWWR